VGSDSCRLDAASQALAAASFSVCKMAAVHLQNAQKELKVGSGIVPVWIMTIDQALTLWARIPAVLMQQAKPWLQPVSQFAIYIF